MACTLAHPLPPAPCWHCHCRHLALQVEAAVSKAVEKFGRLDAVVANAGGQPASSCRSGARTPLACASCSVRRPNCS